MGYDISGYKSRKDAFDFDTNPVAHIMCQYSYQEHFVDVLGFQITDLNAKFVTKSLKREVSKHFKKIADSLKGDVEVRYLPGNISNRSPELLQIEFDEFANLVEKGEIRYLIIN